MHDQQNTEISYSYDYLFDLKSRENQLTYFKMKEKYGYTFSSAEKEQFMHKLLELLSQNVAWVQAKTLIVPETQNIFLTQFVEHCGKQVIVLKKSSKELILEALKEQTMMKTEAAKLFSIINSMDNIKMANIAGNQRKRLIHCLFEQIEPAALQSNEPSVFFDDSIFSGYTFLAAQHQLRHTPHHNIMMFSKID